VSQGTGAGGEVNIDFTDNGTIDGVVVNLTVYSERMSMVGMAMKMAAAEYTAMVERSFANKQAPDGAKWEPLAKTTVDDRIARGYEGTDPRLVREGTLKREVLGKFQQLTASVGPNLTAFELIIDVPSPSSGVNYAAVNLYGGAAGETHGGTPARPFIPIDVRMTQILDYKVRGWIAGELVNNGPAQYTAYDATYG